jgi:hypothetical protein
MGDRRPFKRVSARVREPIRDRPESALARLLRSDDPADLERIAELLGQLDPARDRGSSNSNKAKWKSRKGV